MVSQTILIADDDRFQRQTLRELLGTRLGYHIEESEDGEAAVTRLTYPARPVDLVLLDYYMPRMDGKMALTHIRSAHPRMPVIILTSSHEAEDAAELMGRGASDFISKPFHIERLRQSVKHHLSLSQLTQESARIRRTQSHHAAFDDLIGTHGSLASCVAIGRKAARSHITVLIIGESGTGKEMMARAIHGESPRAGMPFVSVNCGAIPPHLIESTLFGHEKGAFTGATARVHGKFREADGGTLLLDEVGELTPDMQTRLLRVLQEQEVEPVGAARPVKIDVRVISATHRNLVQDVASGRFREDLYYRLHGLPIILPPLRDRAEDIPALVRHILARYCALEQKFPLTLAPDGLQWLCSQRWGGNVRELENLLYRAVVLTETPVLDEAYLSSLSTQMISSLAQASPSVNLLDEAGCPKTLAMIEREVIHSTLTRCHHRIPDAARMLGMGQSTLYKRLTPKRKP